MPTFVFHPSGISEKNIWTIAAHTIGCVMTTTSVGNCLQKILLLLFQICRFLLTMKSRLVLLPTMIDCCCVGFLQSQITRFSELYEDRLEQVICDYSGRSVAASISCLPEESC